jgi:hypothetical protein
MGDEEMRQTTLRIPDLMLLVGTRVALGVGIGLLVATRFDERARKGAGAALVIVGALTTVPILLSIRASRSERMSGSETAARLGASMVPEKDLHGSGALHDTSTP